VIAAAGVSGWGGLADGKLYRWDLIATDPGGDVAIIQMQGDQEFPFTPLGDSDKVRVGDWALAMGNPFILTEDQVPTVTLGIVSGIKRYQPGAGENQLVYGNCIQVDSSINPAQAGLELGDELIEFEGIPIKTANQFTNLICTLPEQWPVELKVRKLDGSQKTYRARAFGLPYKRPTPPLPKNNPTPEDSKKLRRELKLIKLLSAKPGTIRNPEINRKYADQVITAAKDVLLKRREADGSAVGWVVAGTIGKKDQQDDFKLTLGAKGGFRLTPQVLFAIGLAAVVNEEPFSNLPNVSIDGSGKARNLNAWRMAFGNPDETPLYGWFQMYGTDGLPEPQLIKLASDRDASKGGVLFDRWEQKQNRWLPMQSSVVTGMGETPVLAIQVDTVELAKEDDVKFSKLTGTDSDSKTPTQKSSEAP